MTARELVEDFYATGGPVGDPVRLAQYFHLDYLSHTAPAGSEPGIGQAVDLCRWLEDTFSGIEYDLLHLVVEGDFVSSYVHMRAVHTGPGLGVPPTGLPFMAEQMHLMRFAEGRIIEHWSVRDDVGMMRQLGLAPPRA